MTTKMIKDPIHGSIEFEGDAELELKSMLSDPYFQRLRRVKQLGFADFVFPSATHSRFGHSLGVYTVAKRLLSVVEPDVRKGRRACHRPFLHPMVSASSRRRCGSRHPRTALAAAHTYDNR